MDHIKEFTMQLAREGVFLLNFWRLGRSDSEHVRRLLALAAMPQGAHVVDLGCGTGEFARLALDQRPDLRFTLVNNHQWQLQQGPEGAAQVLADMAHTPLADGCADVVVMAYSLGHVDVVAGLEEAGRLLKPGGQLVLHDIHVPDEGAADAVMAELQYEAHPLEHLKFWASMIGFDVVESVRDGYCTPSPTVCSMSRVLDRLDHAVTVFVKADRPHRFRGRKVALQFSGGKDSLACLWLLRPFLPRYITVYWTSTGDTIPETVEVVDWARGWVPKFEVIQADVRAWQAEHGMPSDLVPARNHWMGVSHGMADFRISGRFDCCGANLMAPMHQRMLADGIEMVIRGTKLADTGKLPAEGPTPFYEIVLPLRDWSHDDVFQFISRFSLPLSRVYRHFKNISAPECLRCTAWWDDGKAAYLKEFHPQALVEYRVSLETVRQALAKSLGDLAQEIEGA